MSVVRTALKTQIRVVKALILRETKTLFGKHRLGYLWAFIQAAFLIGVWWALRYFGGFHPPFGMSTPVFLLGGFIPWLMFAETVTGAMHAIGGNRALLAYPQVFPLDLIVARALLIGATYCCVAVLFMAALDLAGYPVRLNDLSRLLLAPAMALLLGFGTGAVCSSLNVFWPTTARLVPMLLRVMFFTSGLFFSVSATPTVAQKILFFNPLSHLIEMFRGGLSASYPTHFVYLPYALMWLLALLSLGLLLERYSRYHIDRET